MEKLAILGGAPIRRRPFPEWPSYQSKEESRAVLDALQSNSLCSAIGGEQTALFETEFSDWCGAVGGVAVNSGSSALQVALAALGVGPGDEVIVPAYTFISSGTSVLMQGAIPVFADVCRETVNLDPESFRNCITERTKAVMPVHANGFPANMDNIMSIANAYGIKVIEDCSHAHGAVYKGIRVGSIGHVGGFSIQHKKILSVGEGGILVSQDQDLIEHARRFRDLGGGSRQGSLGPNLRMGELHLALARIRLGRVDAENEIRRNNAQILLEGVQDLPGLELVPNGTTEDVQGVYYNINMDFHSEEIGISRERFVEAMVAEGIPIQVGGYRSMNLLPVFRFQQAWPYQLAENWNSIKENQIYGEGICPVTEKFLSEGNLELKIHPPCGDREMDDTLAAMKKVLEQASALR